MQVVQLYEKINENSEREPNNSNIEDILNKLVYNAKDVDKVKLVSFRMNKKILIFFSRLSFSVYQKPRLYISKGYVLFLF